MGEEVCVCGGEDNFMKTFSRSGEKNVDGGRTEIFPLHTFSDCTPFGTQTMKISEGLNTFFLERLQWCIIE